MHCWLKITLCFAIVLIVTLIVTYFNRCKMSRKGVVQLQKSIPQIDGGIIDEEHAAIDNAFAHLLKTVKGHWNTEDRLFEEGLNKMPSTHRSVIKEIKEHKKAHADGIEKIEQLRAAIHKHIQEYDVPHFHWLK